MSTTVIERNDGAPVHSVELDVLPQPARTEVVTSRRGDSLRLDVSRHLACRRREFSSARRVHEETSRVSAGSAITGGVFATIGLSALASGGTAGLVFLATGGAIIGLSAAQTGTTSRDLPPETTELSRKVLPCHEQPVPDARVTVIALGVKHEGATDANGSVEFDSVAEGPMRVLVDGTQPARVRERSGSERLPPSPRAPRAPPPEPSAEPAATPAPSTMPPAPLPLPPQPPPPPGARIPD